MLTDKIKEFCQYAEQQRGRPYKLCPYFKHVTEAIYAYVGVSIPKAGQSPRDVYSGDTLEAIETAELVTIDLFDEILKVKGSRKGIKPLIIDRLTHEMGHRL